MINLFNTHIDSLSIHRVGNKSRNEAIFLSEQPFNLNDEIVPLIKEFFFKPFREKEENYFQFAHEVDLDYNEMYKFASQIFDNPSTVHEQLTDCQIFEKRICTFHCNPNLLRAQIENSFLLFLGKV
jgi:hypothetical protein